MYGVATSVDFTKIVVTFNGLKFLTRALRTLSVPVEYFCPLDANGKRKDVDERPELCQGSVEFVAPTEYMVRPPMPPVYFFLIDVSASAIRTGMLQVKYVESSF